MAATLTREERLRALREALRRQGSLGPFSVPVVAGLGAGFLVSFLVDSMLYDVIATPARQFLDAIAFTVVAAPVWLLVQRREVRAATEVLTWLNGWEQERWQREVGRRLPALPRATPRLLDSLPDTLGLRPLRVELLAARGEMDEAWLRLEALPTDTPWQAFERAALDEWIAFLTDAPERIGPMRALARDVGDEERALVARAMVAAAQARRAAVGGGDVVGPLAGLRTELGDRPGRYAFPYGTGVVVSVAAIGLIASVAMTVAAAIIR